LTHLDTKLPRHPYVGAVFLFVSALLLLHGKIICYP